MRPLIATLVILSLLFVFTGGGTLHLKVFISPENSGERKQLPQLYPFPVKVAGFEDAGAISAVSAVVIDAKTGLSLFEKDPTIRHFPASTTKLMTAIVTLEKCPENQVIEVGKVESEETLMGLVQGDRLTVKNLLYGLLVASGNDAAYALAQGCSTSYNQFIASMNQKAKELGMLGSHFSDPAGFDSPWQYSTARDLSKLAQVAVASPLISKIVATKSIVVTDTNGTKTYSLENINQLLGEVEGVEGVKTGKTEGSGEILVTKTTRGSNTIIAVLLGSEDRFGESKKLIEWAFKNYRWIAP